MARPLDLTPEAELGYSAPDVECPFYRCSAAGMAWRVGAHLRTTGRTAPRDVRLSRGYTVHANDMLFACGNATIERIK